MVHGGRVPSPSRHPPGATDPHGSLPGRSPCPSPSAGRPRAAAARPSSPPPSPSAAPPPRCSSTSTASCRWCSDCPSPGGQGVADWLASDADAAALDDLGVVVERTTRLVPRGTIGVDRTSPRWAGAGCVAGRSGRVDRRRRHPAAVARAPAGRRAQPARHPPLLPRPAPGHGRRRAPGRRRARRRARPGPARSRDVEHALGAPVVARVSHDPAIARAVDAGLLRARLPRLLRTRAARCGMSERTIIDGTSERRPTASSPPCAAPPSDDPGDTADGRAFPRPAGRRRWPAPEVADELVRAAVARLDGLGALDALFARPHRRRGARQPGWRGVDRARRHPARRRPAGARRPRRRRRTHPRPARPARRPLVAHRRRPPPGRIPGLRGHRPRRPTAPACPSDASATEPCRSTRSAATTSWPCSTSAVAGRCNVVVSGATSSGKTSLLNSILGRTAPGERIVTIEEHGGRPSEAGTRWIVRSFAVARQVLRAPDGDAAGRLRSAQPEPVEDAAADPVPGGQPAPGAAQGVGALLRPGRDRALLADDRRPERLPAPRAATGQGGRPEPAVDAAGGPGDRPGRRSDQLLGPPDERPAGHLLRGRPIWRGTAARRGCCGPYGRARPCSGSTSST